MSIAPGNANPKLNIAAEIVIAAIAIVGALASAYFELSATTSAAAGLLTATSILTGLTFTMALRFWERSLDARSNVELIFDEERKEVLDSMRTALLWTVLSGVVSTAWLAGMLLVMGIGPAAIWATSLAAGLVFYQLLNVVRSIFSLYGASYTLRP